MATTLTLSHPQFVFVFAAVRRADQPDAQGGQQRRLVAEVR
ncbi:Uncharacterised protein [Serratia plymuthica]|nr:Uncharacterised protein [Serratia plymuthica]